MEVMNLSLQIYNDGERVTAAICGDIDHHSAQRMRSEIDAVISSAQPKLLIFDMSGVGFMDSSGIGLILGRLRILQFCGGSIAVKNACGCIRKMIVLSGLGNYLIS